MTWKDTLEADAQDLKNTEAWENAQKQGDWIYCAKCGREYDRLRGPCTHHDPVEFEPLRPPDNK